jgi:hypothetical protein
MIMLAKFFSQLHNDEVSWILFSGPRWVYIYKVRKESVAQSPAADHRATPKSEPQISQRFWFIALGVCHGQATN